jgi:hypothetical protein
MSSLRVYQPSSNNVANYGIVACDAISEWQVAKKKCSHRMVAELGKMRVDQLAGACMTGPYVASKQLLEKQLLLEKQQLLEKQYCK